MHAKLSASWIETRGTHLLDSRNINAPVDGIYPLSGPGLVLLTESAGLSRLHQLVVNTNVNYKKLSLIIFDVSIQKCILMLI